MKKTTRKVALPPPRNPHALDAKSRHAGPMAHKLVKRLKTRGARNRAALREAGW